VKNYSSNRAQKGKTAYRTPSLFKANKAIFVADVKARRDDKKTNTNWYNQFQQK